MVHDKIIGQEEEKRRLYQEYYKKGLKDARESIEKEEEIVEQKEIEKIIIS
ncbi:MAG: hypothetical protein ABIJ23_05220 [Candidatus Magasanikbacteria bacterium]